MTALAAAYGAMQAAPDDDAARLRFFDRLAASEVFLLLEREAKESTLDPRVFETSDGPFALAFDSEEALADFAGTAHYCAVPGRGLASLLAGAHLGLVLNPGTTDAALSADTLAWLARTLANAPQPRAAAIEGVARPEGLSDRLLTAIDSRLAAAAGLARRAVVAAVTYDDGTRGHLMAFIDALEGTETALANSLNEALVFAEAGPGWDIAFLDGAARLAERLLNTGVVFDLPEPTAPVVPAPPGTDPARPPKLR